MRPSAKARTLKNRGRGGRLQDLKDSVYGETSRRGEESPSADEGPADLSEEPGQGRQGAATAGLSEFIPPPESVGAQRRASREGSGSRAADPHQSSAKGSSDACAAGDVPCTVEDFGSLVDSRANEYYARVAPMRGNGVWQQPGRDSAQRDASLAKLDYLIHLLEEQRDERTGHVTEEIILYSFLGVFMIFIVDSFARAGKYVR